MALVLKTPAALQGLVWIRDGARLFWRQPLGFGLMFTSYLGLVLLVSMVPVLGGPVVLASVPLLSLGMMIGSAEALADKPVKPSQLLWPLKQADDRRKQLIKLGGLYAIFTLVAMLLSMWLDGGAMNQFEMLVGQGAHPENMPQELDDEALLDSLLLRFVLMSLLSLPFWHAPGLVFFGRQKVGQALFSSTLALWRARGAFVLYGLGWAGVAGLLGGFVALLASVPGVGQLVSFLVLPLVLAMCTIFYVSLIFTFNDSFGQQADTPRSAAPLS